MAVRVNPIHRIALTIKILMKRKRVFLVSLVGIPGPKPPRRRVHIASAEGIKCKVRVVLLASVKVVVGSQTSGSNEGSEGIVDVGVGNGCIGGGQVAGVAVTIVAVEAGCADRLSLADEVVAIGVEPDRCAANSREFF